MSAATALPRLETVAPAAAAPDLSVVVVIGRDGGSVAGIHRRYRLALASLGLELEFLYVLDGPLPRTLAALRELRSAGEIIEILTFSQSFGEAAALTVGFRRARAPLVMTLPLEPAVADADLPRLVEALGTSDMVVARRSAAAQPELPKLERTMRILVGSPFHDLRCAVRVMKAEVAAELTLYGNQAHFLPLVAGAQGFAVREVEVGFPEDAPPKRARGINLSLALDVVTIFFLIKFMRKPFRFFGGIGFGILAVGGLATAWLVFSRLALGVPLADRPALILSTLMIVLGIQVIAVGLIGEIITFAYAREIKDYKVERIVD
jgi:hypothetical protein